MIPLLFWIEPQSQVNIVMQRLDGIVNVAGLVLGTESPARLGNRTRTATFAVCFAGTAPIASVEFSQALRQAEAICALKIAALVIRSAELNAIFRARTDLAQHEAEK